MTEKILLLGKNNPTTDIARNLNDSDVDLVVATPVDKADLSAAMLNIARSNQGLQLMTQSQITDCHGSLGDFTVEIKTGQQSQSLDISQIIIAEDAVHQVDYSAQELHTTASIVSLTKIEEIINSKAEIDSIYTQAQTVAFLLGLAGETTPANTRRAIKAAQFYQETGKQVYIFTGNLKVGEQGLERLFRNARKAGVIFIKFNHSTPRIQMDDRDRVIIEFDDEIAGRPFRVSPDATVLDEIAQPATYLQHLIHLFKLETDPSGFAQGDNVHRIGLKTNRSGILVAGPARNALNRHDHQLDVDAAVLACSISVDTLAPADKARAEIDTGSCIRCLTCHRLCPHGAIEVNTRVQVLPVACEACGICAAECPREAILLPGVSGSNIEPSFVKTGLQNKTGEFMPSILAFCCSRSAFPASRLADCLSPSKPKGIKIVEIPCAGSLSLDHILTGFQGGADGTLVLTCHADNCHAGHGNQHAWERVALMQAQFSDIGFEKERLQVTTLASNMGAAFAKIVTEFEKKLKVMGPSRLKQQH